MTLNWCCRPSEAAEYVKHAMRLSPIHSAWYLAVLAHAYRHMLRYDEAVNVYKQAIALAPNQIAAHLGRSILDLQGPGRFKASLEALAKAFAPAVVVHTAAA